MFCVGLQKLIDERNISRKEISEVIGQSVSQVGMYIQGRRDPDTEVLLKLSKHYKVSIDSLLMNESANHICNDLKSMETQLLRDFEKLPKDIQQDILSLVQHVIDN
nr:MAG TPA: helix-turn-helix XRE-family like protein [Caudoviricetes sp.]